MSHDIKHLAQTLGHLQGTILAHHHVLRQLIVHVAQAETDQKKFLSGLLDVVAEILEQEDHMPGVMENRVYQEAKLTLESLIIGAANDLDFLRMRDLKKEV